MKKYLIAFFMVLMVCIPSFAGAQYNSQDDDITNDMWNQFNNNSNNGAVSTSGFNCPSTPTGSVTSIIDWFTCFIGKSIIPLLFALAFLYFIWGVAEFIRNSDNEAKRTEGRKRMIWGIVALFVMLSVWGLVAILRSTFGVENVIPQLK